MALVPPILTVVLAPLILAPGEKNAGAHVKRRYNRDAAIAYAREYWNKHCSDGFVAVKASKPPAYREVDPGEVFMNAGVDGSESARRSDGGQVPWSDLDDCAHFVSCCVGRPFDAKAIRATNPRPKPADAPRIPAGGLNVPQLEGLGSPWVYGIVGVPRLVDFLGRPDVGTVTARHLPALEPKLEAAVRNLQAGDVIALSNERFGYTHAVLYDGNQGIFCHTRCRGGERWRMNTLARYTCIHIHDAISGP